MPRLRPVPDKKEEIEKKAVAAEPEVIVEEPELEVEVADEPEPDQNEASLALQKELDTLRQSERLLKEQNAQTARERDDAVRQAREFNAERARAEKESQEYQETSIVNALAAAKSEMAKAKMDKKNAIDLGDTGGQVDADERMAMAAAVIRDLQNGKDAFEARAKEPPQPAQAERPAHVVDTWNLPPNTSVWLKANPDFYSSPDRINSMRYWADKAEKNGLRAHSDEHIKWIDAKMREELGGQPEPEKQIEVKQPAERQVQVSAPVSRDVPAANGKRQNNKITLTREQVEAAKASGISNEEYAKNLMLINELKANGQYGDRQ